VRQLNVGAFEGVVGDITMATEIFTFNASNTNLVNEFHTGTMILSVLFFLFLAEWFERMALS
jgi:hypothetical protein